MCCTAQNFPENGGVVIGTHPTSCIVGLKLTSQLVLRRNCTSMKIAIVTVTNIMANQDGIGRNRLLFGAIIIHKLLRINEIMINCRVKLG